MMPTVPADAVPQTHVPDPGHGPNQSSSSTAHWLTGLFLLVGLGLGSTAVVLYTHSADQAKIPEPLGTAWKYEQVFTDWPQGKKPDCALVITGQTFGYLQKCGCSNPQKGGLERRYNLIAGLKERGIEVVALDVGDLAPQLSENPKLLHGQALLKYGTAMRIMKALGYQAVGLGKEEFALRLDAALGEFSLQAGNETPAILAANLMGLKVQGNLQNKAVAYPNAEAKPMIQDWQIISTKNNIPVGVVGIIGEPVITEIKKLDAAHAFAENSAPIVAKALADMKQQTPRPQLFVMLYNGPLDLAKKVAGFFPELDLIACLSSEDEPPNLATKVGKTMIVQVGHKGKNIGVVGVFKGDNNRLDLKYQRVALLPEFETPAAQAQQNPALVELERYSQTVKARNFLAQLRKGPHPLQVVNPKAMFVGSDRCTICHTDHGNASAVYSTSKHANAYNALEKIAARPSLRNYDPECISCHVVGYFYNSGFENEKKTTHLKNVGCESCHGPGSQHVEQPNVKKLAQQLSPWKANGGGQLPSLEKMLQSVKAEANPGQPMPILTQSETVTLRNADRICQSCHNPENDPHFKFEVFWPKIAHSKMAAKKPIDPQGVNNQPDTDK